MTDPEKGQGEEHPQSTQEMLDAYLAGETLGSIKYTALVDCAEFMRIMGRLNQDRDRIGRNTPFMVAKWAAVHETIRTRRFGENGSAYSHAFDEASIIIERFGAETPLKAAGINEYDSDWEAGAEYVLQTSIASEDLQITINVD